MEGAQYHDDEKGEDDSQNHPVLRELKLRNNYNPVQIDLHPDQSRFFVIKSYSEDDIHRSIKYEIWCSTEHGNKRLDLAFRERQNYINGSVYLFFSVNGSGHFCGMARMMSSVDYDSTSSVWAQDKWKGQFKVRWIYVKDIPNGHLRHITLENNENKPVTNSRDTQEVLLERGKQVLAIFHKYKHCTSIFDDFSHYEMKQEAEGTRRQPSHHHNKGKRGGYHHQHQPHPQQQQHQREQHPREQHHSYRDDYHHNPSNVMLSGGK